MVKIDFYRLVDLLGWIVILRYGQTKGLLRISVNARTVYTT